LLYGDSGAGKTSLLNAGVIPRFREQSRTETKRWGKPAFQIIAFRSWLDDPVAAFHGQLRQMLSEISGSEPQTPNGSASLAAALRQAVPFADRRLLVVFDQCEEYFRYLADGKSSPEFLRQFEGLWKDSLPVHFLISLREDSLGALDRLKRTVPNLFDNSFRLQHLTTGGAADAILKPVDEYNRRVEAKVTITAALADKVIEKILGRPPETNQTDRLPAAILQLVLTRWWDRQAASGRLVFDEETLNSLGGVENIVRDHFRETIAASLLPAQQVLAVQIFVHLVTESGRKMAVTDREIAGAIGIPVAEVRAVLSPLVPRRVLATVPNPSKAGPDDVCYEFSHDLLAAAALEWRKEKQQAERERAAHEEAERQMKTALDHAEEEKQKALEGERAERERALRRSVRRIALALAAALICLAVAIVQTIAARRESNLATARQTATQSELSLRDHPENLETAAILALQSIQLVPLFENDFALRKIAALLRPLERRISQDAPVLAVAFSSDGRYLATGAEDGSARVWEAATGKEAFRWNKAGPIHAVAFDRSNRILAIAGPGHVAHLWQFGTGNDFELPHDDTVYSVAFSPDGKLVATSALRDPVRLWDVATRKERRRIANAGLSDDAVAFSPDGKLVAIASFGAETGGLARIIYADNGRELTRFPLATGASSVVFSPDGALLAVGEGSGIVQTWDVAGHREGVRANHGSAVHSIALSPNGKFLATAGDDGTARLWDPASGTELARLSNFEIARDVAFSPDSQTIAGVGDDHSVRLWQTKPGTSAGDVANGPAANIAVFDAGGTALVVDGPAPQGGQISLVRDGQSRAAFAISDRARAAAASPNGEYLAVATMDNTIWLWKTAGGQPPKAIHYTGVNALRFGPDSTLATVADDQTLRLWNPDSGDQLMTLHHPTLVMDLVFTPDGEQIISSGSDNIVRVWSRREGRELAELNQATSPFRLAISLDGRWLATGDANNTVVVWNLSTRGVHRRLPYSGELTAIVFGHNGQLLTATRDDSAIHIWDPVTGQEITRSPLPLQPVAVSFHPESLFLKVAARSPLDNSLTLLQEPLDPRSLARQVCAGIAVPASITICR
jgi:WD40 repeat protein